MSSLMSSNMRNPVFVALDLDSDSKCMNLVEQLGQSSGGYKIGPRLLMRYGPRLVNEINKHAPVFIDNKYLDIPNTMESAIRASYEVGASFATVHAWAGPEALRRLAKLEAELSQERPFKILAVTILTSFSSATLPAGLADISIDQHVDMLAEMAVESGVTGLVCSAHEVSKLRKRFPRAFLVTPGIRSPDDATDDQKRTASPSEALNLGASALVIGRPIVEAKSPLERLQRILDSINK